MQVTDRTVDLSENEATIHLEGEFPTSLTHLETDSQSEHHLSADPENATSTVYLSYARCFATSRHRDNVVRFAGWLNTQLGCNVICDIFEQNAVSHNVGIWFDDKIAEANHIILICSRLLEVEWRATDLSSMDFESDYSTRLSRLESNYIRSQLSAMQPQASLVFVELTQNFRDGESITTYLPPSLRGQATYQLFTSEGRAHFKFDLLGNLDLQPASDSEQQGPTDTSESAIPHCVSSV